MHPKHCSEKPIRLVEQKYSMCLRHGTPNLQLFYRIQAIIHINITLHSQLELDSTQICSLISMNFLNRSVVQQIGT